MISVAPLIWVTAKHICPHGNKVRVIGYMPGKMKPYKRQILKKTSIRFFSGFKWAEVIVPVTISNGAEAYFWLGQELLMLHV